MSYSPAATDNSVPILKVRELKVHFPVTVDPNKFLPDRSFYSEVDGVLKHVKSTPTNPGIAEILIPGEIEYKTRDQRERGGIPVGEVLWSNICELAEELGVQMPD